VIQISSTSFSQKIWFDLGTNKSYIIKVSTAVLHRAKNERLYINSTKNFCQGIFRLSQQNILLYHSLIQVLMDCHSCFHFLLEINHYYFFSCWLKNISKCFVFLNLFNLFLLPTLFQIFFCTIRPLVLGGKIKE
jgi:hypothetical protein